MVRQKEPKRLKRSESFLGIHFDFHAKDVCKTIGKRVTPQMVHDIIDKVQPDYIQCDCKGHRGFSSYATKVGNQAPGLVKDQLKVWRKVTAQRGVALYMHYSGVWDTQAIKKHPSWARIDENGKRDPNNTSVFGPYVDKLLIPQLKELCDDYKVDGVWLDGECWATCQDYHKKVLKAFREKTGIKAVPKKPDDDYFYEFTEFCRQGFRDYLQYYINELHRHNPEFQIASNWAYSSFMPEKPTIDVDFISGDYPLLNSVNAARLEGRCMAPQGIPWDLMAWGFVCRWGEGVFNTKTPAQLQQEAAIVLALGGGFQAYFRQQPDGSIYSWQMSLMQEAAKFCRARQAVCHKAQAVPQVALLNSGEDFYRRNRRVFSPWEGILNPLKGVLCNLLDNQQSVEVLSEHHLTGQMEKYPLIVLPETQHLTRKFKKDLLAYVEQGGKLLVIGAEATKLFRKELGVKISSKVLEKPWIEVDGSLVGSNTPSLSVKPQRGTKAVGYYHHTEDMASAREVAATVRKLGKGDIAGVYLNLGENYLKARTSGSRHWLGALVSMLFPEPMVEVTGSHHVDVCVNQKDGSLMVNLVNTAGPHGDEDTYVFDEIPTVGPLEITLRLPAKPKRIVLQPEKKAVSFTWKQGQAKLTLPQLKLHDILQIDA